MRGGKALHLGTVHWYRVSLLFDQYLIHYSLHFGALEYALYLDTILFETRYRQLHSYGRAVPSVDSQ